MVSDVCLALKKIRYENVKLTLDDFRGELRNYQKAGIVFSFLNKVSLLADEQGLGKFIQFLGVCLYARKKNIKYKTLFVTLPSLKYQAKSEIEKFSGDVFNIKLMESGLAPDKRKKVWQSDCDIIIVNYEMLYRDIDWLIKQNIDINFICFDECTVLRNINKTHQKIIKLTKIIRKSDSYKILFMTGSPIGKNIYDLYNIFSIGGLSYKIFGGEDNFRKKYCVFEERFIGYQKIYDLVGFKNESDFSNKVNPFIIRRRKRDVIKDLPKIITHNYSPELNKEQWQLYNAIDEDEDLNNLQKIVYLRMVCDLPQLIPDTIYEKYDLPVIYKSGKLEAFSQLLESIIEDNKIIIFSNSKKSINYLYDDFSQKYKSIKITGDITDKSEREKLKERFNNNTDVKLLFATDCLAFGANLQSADTIIQFRVSWSSIIDEQRICRIDRIGQLAKVLNIYNLICMDTIEEKVRLILNKNKKIAAKILRDTDIINYIDIIKGCEKNE